MKAQLLMVFALLTGCNEITYEQFPEDTDDIVFESNWTTALGTADSAVRDGGRWSSPQGSAGLFEVIPGGPSGTNFLRVPRHGSGEGDRYLSRTDFLPAGESFYVRFYIVVEDNVASTSAVATMRWTNPHRGITFVRRTAHTPGWTMETGIGEELRTNGVDDVTASWMPADADDDSAIPYGSLYRFEYRVEYTGPARVRVFPRVYDDAGVLRWEARHFRRWHYGSGTWNGSNTWTLQSFYDAGFDFEIDPAAMNELALGDAGSASAPGTHDGWSFGAAQIRTGRWPGAASP